MKPSSFTVANAFSCAFRGVMLCFSGRNFKIQFCLGILAVILGFVFHIASHEWIALIICISLVLGGEVGNTALEVAVDLVTDSYHDLARDAKDCAAGAVLLFSIASLIVGCIIFIPKIAAFCDVIL